MNLDAKTQTRHCVLCERDCSGVPRIRDRGGRYYCRTCHERASLALELSQLHDAPNPVGRARRRRRRKNGEVARTDAVVATSGTRATTDRVQGGQPSPATCPSCRLELASEAVFCVGCGYDLRSGQKVDGATATMDSPAPTASRGRVDTRKRSVRRALWTGGLLLIAAVSTVVALVV